MINTPLETENILQLITDQNKKLKAKIKLFESEKPFQLPI